VTTQIKEKMELKAKLHQSREQNIADIKKLDSRVDKTNNEITAINQKLNQQLHENPWVRAEKDMFDNPESAEYSNLHNVNIPQAKL